MSIIYFDSRLYSKCPWVQTFPLDIVRLLWDGFFVGGPFASAYQAPLPSRPMSIPSLITPPLAPFNSNVDAALYWFKFGLMVIPILPHSKQAVMKWDPWLATLSIESIQNHWSKNPSHELACIVGDNLIVLDTDSPAAGQALGDIEANHGCPPLFVVKTKHGHHHYFRLAPGAYAKSDSHYTDTYPDRIDVKTGRGMIVLPPSTDKTISSCYPDSVEGLHEVNQDFIDAVFKHNGRQPPRPSEPPIGVTTAPPVTESHLAKLEALLAHISPDGGYEDWLHVLMAIFHETQGGEEGLALADRWSSQGEGYSGQKEIDIKWRSFRLEESNPVTLGTLIKLAKEGGGDVQVILGSAADKFEACEYEVISPSPAPVQRSESRKDSPLAAFSLRGHLSKLESQMMEQKHILGNLVLLGQATAIYARANTGKTLLMLHLIIQSIKQGIIDPARLFYINMDDNSSGLVDKARLAEEYGFHMVADGHQAFEASAFRVAMETMIATDTARGVMVFLDTLKKFVNTMDKGKSSDFAKVIRQFSLKGGTVIALSHANKNPGADGRAMYSGTSDIVDDFDCAYMLNTVSQQSDLTQKVVEFSNIKRRGNVAQTAAYSYTLDADIPYNELLLSVQEINPDQLTSVKQATEVQTDAQIIESIAGCLRDGIDSKMKLAEAAAERAGCSKRSALKVVDKYTGNDPAIHQWSFTVRERGAKGYGSGGNGVPRHP